MAEYVETIGSWVRLKRRGPWRSTRHMKSVYVDSDGGLVICVGTQNWVYRDHSKEVSERIARYIMQLSDSVRPQPSQTDQLLAALNDKMTVFAEMVDKINNCT
jgi:hypothetical protein